MFILKTVQLNALAGGKYCTHTQTVNCKEDMERQTKFGVKGKIISDNVLSISGSGDISGTKDVEYSAIDPAHIGCMKIDSDTKLGKCS